MPPSVPTGPALTTDSSQGLREAVAAISTRRRLLISSHARPDGDSIGSQLAMAYALRALGKQVRVVNKDLAPDALRGFPGVEDIELADRVIGDFDAVIVMECSDLGRTGVEGLERFFAINIDHHPGNSGFGQVNWFDPSAAACAEMVFDLIRALGVPLSLEIATHVYLAILTDTGSFRYSGISPRTFEICRQTLEAGVDPVFVARTVYDSSSLSRLRLIGAALHAMEIDASGRIATLYLDHAMAQAAAGTYDDTEGLINLPLSVKAIQGVVFFKEIQAGEYRVSMRSKGDTDVNAIANDFGGGGHKNASGCSAHGELRELKALFVNRIAAAIDATRLKDPSE